MLNKAQQKASNKIQKRLSKYGISCLWGEARSGKSRAFLDASRNETTLVITEKSAISGVLSEAKEIGVDVDVINYQSVQKMNPDAYTLIIADECHRFISQAKPKPATTWKNVVKFTKGKKLILASATPTSEGFSGLYYQLGLSSYSPFKHPRFTKFFEEYGTSKKIWTGIRLVPDYKACNVTKVQQEMEHLVVKLTRKKTGHKFESKDVIHNIPLHKKQQKLFDILREDKLWIKKGVEILADTGVKMLGKLHQISGGVGVKGEEDELYLFKKLSPKVKYIKDNFNVDNTIILSYYKHEQELLKTLFPHTGSVTKLSTGVDLSHYDSLIIYSMAFSSANYFQVKARLMNVNRKTQMHVHYLISGIDEFVLKAVQSKSNFTTRWFK